MMNYRDVSRVRRQLLADRPPSHKLRCKCRPCRIAKAALAQARDDFKRDGSGNLQQEPQRIGGKYVGNWDGRYEPSVGGTYRDRRDAGEPGYDPITGKETGEWKYQRPDPPSEDRFSEHEWRFDNPSGVKESGGTYRQQTADFVRGWRFRVDFSAPPGANLRRYFYGRDFGRKPEPLLWEMLLLASPLLSEPEFAALSTYWDGDLTEIQAASELGISRTAFTKNLERAARKFGAILEGTVPRLAEGRSLVPWRPSRGRRAL